MPLHSSLGDRVKLCLKKNPKTVCVCVTCVCVCVCVYNLALAVLPGVLEEYTTIVCYSAKFALRILWCGSGLHSPLKAQHPPTAAAFWIYYQITYQPVV